MDLTKRHKPSVWKQVSTASILGAAVLISGCATYIPPGAKADLQAFAPPDIQAGFAAKPTNPFPASIAVVRVQSPTYSNYYIRQNGGRYGSGRYSVILAKEENEDSQLEQVTKLRQVTGLVSLNRLLLPERLDSDQDIRSAASRLQADADEMRRTIEQDAFKKLVDDLAASWPKLLERYAQKG
jgi:hypothetical protein